MAKYPLPLLASVFGAALLLAPPLRAQSPQERLWDASMAGDTVAIAAALDAGARIDSLDVRRNPNGRRALNWAAWYDRAPAIRLLVARGASVNAFNNTGFTPLHHAAESGSVSAAEALLAAGADRKAANFQGELPADVARLRGHPEIARLIEANPADSLTPRTRPSPGPR